MFQGLNDRQRSVLANKLFECFLNFKLMGSNGFYNLESCKKANDGLVAFVEVLSDKKFLSVSDVSGIKKLICGVGIYDASEWIVDKKVIVACLEHFAKTHVQGLFGLGVVIKLIRVYKGQAYGRLFSKRTLMITALRLKELDAHNARCSIHTSAFVSVCTQCEANFEQYLMLIAAEDI